MDRFFLASSIPQPNAETLMDQVREVFSNDTATGSLRKGIFLTVLVGVGLVAFYWSAISEALGWGGDFALYVLHARNLADGLPYGDTGYIYNPQYPSLSPPAYPPRRRRPAHNR